MAAKYNRKFCTLYVSLPAMVLRSFMSLLFCFAACVLNYHCRQSPKQPIYRSFYYWKSVFALSPKERDELASLQVTRLYVRFFDVTWDGRSGQAAPNAIIRFRDTSYLGYDIVPVVFISNEVFAGLDSMGLSSLATNIAGLLHQLQTNNRLPQPEELQLDCDWTATTRD